MGIQYTGKDQNWAAENTIYWFETDHGKFGVVEGNDSGIVDNEGFPIRGRGDQNTIERTLADAVTDEMRAS